MTDETTVWRMWYAANGKLVEAIAHAQRDEASSLCEISIAEGMGWWRGVFAAEAAPLCPRCLVVIDREALLATVIVEEDEE